MKRFIIVVAVSCTLLTSCASLDKAYVTADKATLDAIGPQYSKYVENDTSLTPEQKTLYLNTVKVWEQRVQAAGE